MAKYGGFDDDEDDVLAPKEPQVTSQDPDERKAARALRIKRRQDAIKRAEQPSEEVAGEEEPGLIEQATTNAAEELQRLALDGAAKVTNVKVTTDEREVIRRNALADKMKDSFDKIEQEATEAQLQYEAISSHWAAMFEIKDPLDIDATIQDQKHKCDKLIEQKNRLIDDFKEDLQKLDQAYYDDLDKQDSDIKELSDRIEKQLTIMQRVYEKQLGLIEGAIDSERTSLIEHNNKRWEALYKQRDKEEVAHMEFKEEQLEAHKEEIEAIMWNHHEKYREAKIELETLTQELQKELEKLKATCLINSEKIGYNYQVLKKREEENVFVRSQQKRKLNKMSDVANSLRSKIRKAAEDGAIEEIKADTEIVKLMEAMANLEKKSYHFSHVNNYKFCQVWRMSAAKCAELAREVRKAEVALHAQILAEPAPAPPPPPPKNPLLKYELEEEARLKQKRTNVAYVEDTVPNNTLDKDAKDRLVRHILKLVADNTGFLVEDRLLALIEKYQQTSRNLCTLDSIFMALEIQAEEDIELLCKTFLNYAFCPICIGYETSGTDVAALTAPSEDENDSRTASMNTGRSRERMSIRPMSIARSMSASTSRSIHVGFRGPEPCPEDVLLMTEADKIIQKCKDPYGKIGSSDIVGGSALLPQVLSSRRGPRGVTVTSKPFSPSKPANPFLCPAGHSLEIEPMQVLTALGDFISNFIPPEKKKLYDILDSVTPPNFSSASRKIPVNEIEQYWCQWKNVFPAEKDRFWDGLLTGLNNYLPLLQERERLHDEVVGLRQRNAALRRLVRGALPEIPPVLPKYARQRPDAFTAAAPDLAIEPDARLPPI